MHFCLYKHSVIVHNQNGTAQGCMGNFVVVVVLVALPLENLLWNSFIVEKKLFSSRRKKEREEIRKENFRGNYSLLKFSNCIK